MRNAIVCFNDRNFSKKQIVKFKDVHNAEHFYSTKTGDEFEKLTEYEIRLIERQKSGRWYEVFEPEDLVYIEKRR